VISSLASKKGAAQREARMILLYLLFAVGGCLIIGGACVWWKRPQRVVRFGFTIPKIGIDKLALGGVILVVGVGLLTSPFAILAYFHADAFFDLLSHVVPAAHIDPGMTQKLCGSTDDAFVYLEDASVLDLRGYRSVPKFLTNMRMSPANLLNTMRITKVKDERYVRMEYGTTSPAGIEARCLDRSYKRDFANDGNHPTIVGLCIDTDGVAVGQDFTVTNEITYWNAYNDPEHWNYESYTNRQSKPERITIGILFPNKKPFVDQKRYSGQHGHLNELDQAPGRVIDAVDRLHSFWTVEATPRIDDEITYKVAWTWNDR